MVMICRRLELVHLDVANEARLIFFIKCSSREKTLEC